MFFFCTMKIVSQFNMKSVMDERAFRFFSDQVSVITDHKYARLLSKHNADTMALTQLAFLFVLSWQQVTCSVRCQLCRDTGRLPVLAIQYGFKRC